MILTLVQLLIALSLLIVETVIAIAVHSHFAQPLESIKSWFLAHRRLSLRVILPVLLVLNFGMAVLFSFTLGPLEASEESTDGLEFEEPPGIARDFFETLPEIQQPGSPEPEQHQAEEPRIMQGLPADSTLNTPSQHSGNTSVEKASNGR